METDIRSMHADDLVAVHALQIRCYAPDLHEAPAVLAARLQLYPSGCQVALRHGDIAAYLFSHPWLGPRPPPLDVAILDLPSRRDHYYLHDLVVDECHRGQRLGQRLSALALAQAQREGLDDVRLVAVQSSAEFWRRSGFVPAPVLTPAAVWVRASYGDDACLMVRGA